MRITIPRTRKSGPVPQAPIAPARAAALPGLQRSASSFPRLAGAAALLLAAALMPAQTAQAQTAPATPAAQSSGTASAATSKPVHHHKRPSPAHPAPEPTAVVLGPVTPPEPPKPNWPAFDKPAEASVVWDSQGLRIDAANSSLEQILKDVSTATGAKIEGFGADQRVFGQYGPGQARDVLSQLLQGSGYNVIMIGGQGQGAPRQVLLSARQAGGAQPSARAANTANNEEDEVEEPPANQEQNPGRPGFPPGAPPRTPQQIMQEMQQRQQQGQPTPGQPQPQPQN